MGGDPRFDFSRTFRPATLRLCTRWWGGSVRVSNGLNSSFCPWTGQPVAAQKWRASEFPSLLMANWVMKALLGHSVIEWKPNIEHAFSCRSCSCKVSKPPDVDLLNSRMSLGLYIEMLCLYTPQPIYTTHYKALVRPTFRLLANSSCKFEFLTPDRLPSPSKHSSGSTVVASTSAQVHNCRNSGSSLYSIASTTLSPITGKNLYACPLPPVARKRPS